MKIEIIAKKNLKFSSKLFHYCFSVGDRKKFFKASVSDKFEMLRQLERNGNITPQQMINILLNYKSPL
jgi:hypothetical protein